METQSQTLNARSGAAERLRAYLQCLGIDDDAALHRLSEQLFQRAARGDTADDLEQVVIDEALRCTEAWLSALHAYAAHGNPSRRDPMAGWRLRRMLEKDPDLLLCRPASEQCAAAGAGDTRAVPAVRESDMPIQPLDQLPAGLRKEFWRTVAAQLKRGWRKIARRAPQE